MQKARAQERENSTKIHSCKKVATILKTLMVPRFFRLCPALFFRVLFQRQNEAVNGEEITKNPLTFCIQFGLIPFSDCKHEV
jgi:hypothetical protein